MINEPPINGCCGTGIIVVGRDQFDASNILLFTDISGECVMVPAEDRTIEVPAEDRDVMSVYVKLCGTGD
jgi:hypothetical protein